MIRFQNCIRWPRPPTKTVAIIVLTWHSKVNVYKSTMKLLDQLEANFVLIVLWQYRFSIIFDDLDMHPRWSPSANIVLHVTWDQQEKEKCFKIFSETRRHFSVDNSSCRHFSKGLFKSGERYRLTWTSSFPFVVHKLCKEVFCCQTGEWETDVLKRPN